MKRLVQVMAVAVVAGLASGPGPARAQAPAKTEVRLAVLAPSSLLWLHAIAKTEGFYAERNIDIKELVAAGSPALLQAVSSGSVEAGIAVADLAIRAIDKDAPIVIAGAVLHKSVLRLVGGKGVTKISDMAGKPVTAGGVSGGTANLLRYLVKRAGVDDRSLRLVAMANSKDRIVAMDNGQVQGALLIAPFDTMAQRNGMKVLDDYTDPYLQTPLILNKDWAAKNRLAAEGVTQALQKAANWIYAPANKQRAIDILATYTNVAKDVCAESYAFVVEQQKAIAPDLDVSAASLTNLILIDNAVSDNPSSSREFVLSRYYDPSFRKSR
ncbi:ABC transporter substrate-binding protein [Rhodoplanes sp. TEM]|uniref:ABC transporter substrate-binding protein n=1 Tax=Rhodoplanes tepidamans TaxID=200616 RepID=A0ABT5J7A1_RHOTP|nr:MULTISPECIES: ABC transporter substrate-binding protein [Rhodoplanes]MDC7785535.1 ABC transporter substrate-binding protein [Rhodoplanes tepidamans]MDC7986183.1 ABC transporter substrate-binding protein [Rhodoplanes sp. TEM]MDQ0353295.1 ABC-type nitrate/sulfonate/bicarbonate transport system substrate-binding protein [Rhodoplanes tepidamans]